MIRNVSALAIAASFLVACDASTPSDPYASFPQHSIGAEPAVTGAGHLERDLGNGPELTTFSYSAVAHADGSASGAFQYHFRANDLKVHGVVTCVTTRGNEAWIGGVITRLTSTDPADQELVGTDIWWRVVDGDDVPDQTTSLLFKFPGDPTTAQSWCDDQPARGLTRPIQSGNIQVRS
jgi:hypothetical protein